jgi:hypothetical protein
MKLTPEMVTFLLGSAVVPALLVFINFFVRKVKNWYYTAGTDFLLTELTFSFSAAILWKDMVPYIHNPFIQATANAIFITLGIIISGVWFLTASLVETEVNKAIRTGKKAKDLPQFKLFLSWLAVIVFFSVEVASFILP